jgi:N-acetylmuramoyl-L-alanine amidase
VRCEPRRHVPESTQSQRLRARVLRAAVEDNADVVAGRVPAPLRRGTRLVRQWERRAWVLAIPLAVMAASGLVGSRSAAVEAVRPAAAIVQGAKEAAPAIGELTRGLRADPALLSRPLGAAVLALGVRRVVIDPGHGGENLGTSSAGGLLEKELTLDLSRRVRDVLVGRGVDVVLTRKGDETLSLKDRAAAATGWRGDIFVSIHLNSLAPSTLRGIETFYLGPGERPEHNAIASKENEDSGYSLADMRTLLEGIYADARREESKRLALSVQRTLVGRLTALDPRITDRGVKTAPFIVLVATEMPAILAEVSCLSNPEDARKLRTETYQQTIAEALASGIQDFIDHKVAGEQKHGSQS